MSLLDALTGPSDLDGMSDEQLVELATEIRDFLVAQVSRTGGHLGPNLGVVELSIALHREFDSPQDAILWDTGHQAYVHKILTGRAEAFGSLRQRGGLSGYPSRAESPHDVIENSHASTALSYADGIAKAWQIKGELASGRPAEGRHVVTVVGDGSLTGGMAWEALNNIAGAD
ncbi:MAG: 1-deoxy-D-xylulose-5-phosphate synthase N-terminal domain-containing protein, partial [Candidatus Nanopelagicales bacterium]|nr:1-deoxy-D-xylulose-5-phosphate synthase N-terminal domain-containing protein [Candidatus Nanopelagicales bacterium]